MENTTIINILRDASQDMPCYTAGYNSIQKLVENLRTEELLKPCKASRKSGMKAVKRFCEKAGKTRPVLGYSNYDENRKLYCQCDSYFAAYTKDTVMQPVPDGMHYPDMTKIIPDFYTMDYTAILPADVLNAVKFAKKIKEEAFPINYQSFTEFYNPAYLQMAFDILNYTENPEAIEMRAFKPVEFTTCTGKHLRHKPAIIKNIETGEFVLVLPMLVNN